MTKAEVVDWLLRNGFEQRSKRKVHFYRSYTQNGIYFKSKEEVFVRPRKFEDYVTIWKGSLLYSDTGEKDNYEACDLKDVYIDDEGWLRIGYVWEVKPWLRPMRIKDDKQES